MDHSNRSRKVLLDKAFYTDSSRRIQLLYIIVSDERKLYVKHMKARIAIVLALLSTLLLVSNTRADWLDHVNPDEGYFITSRKTGEEASEVFIVTAGTTDKRVEVIKFAWFAPDGSLTRITPKIPVKERESQYTNKTGSYTVYFAEDEFKTDFPGYLRVVAIFQDDSAITLQTQNHKIAVRINLLNVVPEIQLAGTAGSTGIMLLGLGFYIKKKRQKQCL